jgi:hypothetical protein
VSNGVQTLQAADTGITGITSLVNQLQATARQALQASASYTSKASISTGDITGITASDLLAGATGTGVNAVLTATGTAISAPVAAGHAVATATNTISAPVQGTHGTQAAASFVGPIDLSAAGSSISFDLAVDGGTAQTVTISASDVNAALGTSDGKINNATDFASVVNEAIGNTSLTGVTASDVGGALTLTSSSRGTSSTIAITNVASDDGSSNPLSDVGGLDSLGTAQAGAAPTGGVDASTPITFDVNGEQVTLAANGGTNSDGHYSAQDVADAINSQVGTSAKVNATVDGSGHLVVTSTNTAGAADQVEINNFSGTGNDATLLGFAAADETDNGTAPSGGVDATVAGGVSFEINGQTVTLSATGGTNGDGHYSANDIKDAINTQVGTSAKVSATVNGSGELVLTSTGTAGSSDAVGLSGFTGTTASALGFTTSSASGSETYSGGPTNGLAGKTLVVTGTDGTTQKTITFGSETGNVSTLDDLNTALSSLNLQAMLSSDGALTITTTNSAGAESFSIDGSSTAVGTGAAFASNTVSAVVMNGDGQEARDNFVTQYNSLLSQIDSLAQDSSYNGVNLLANDDLTITMNETGSSTLNIKGVNDSSAGLGLSSLSNSDFADSVSINNVLSTLNTAVSTLRSQSSQFGSNLSVVQTRQTFTNSLVNVLQTGSANLTTADTNQVSADLLALQTRQQLSTTALSMASQADQNVLRLFQ